MNVGEELQRMLNQLSLQFEHVSLRGQGWARFVFAQHNARAVELSENEGKWWLEFWDADPDVDAGPVKEATFKTADEAVREATDWLASGPGQPVLADIQREAPRA